MRSGWEEPDRDWTNEYYRSGLVQFTSCKFAQRTFSHGPALIKQTPPGGYQIEREFRGQQFDEKEWRLVADRWDHQHCLVCTFKIVTGHTYWENEDGLIACDVCHDFVVASAALQANTET